MPRSVSGRHPADSYVGPYAIEQELGRGSYGVVYLARRDPDAPHVALKVHLAPEDAEGLARFQRESVLASRLDHPGIVGALESGFHGRHPWVATEYVEGETLRERLKRGPLDAEETRRLANALAESLAYAHEQGVIHRDLKPANVILSTPDGSPRILDFGLAHDDQAVKSLTRTGDMIGSPYYMSPEQLVDSKHVDARSDIYAVGVILYECLAGQRPFEGSTAHEIFLAIRRGRPPSLRPRAPQADAALVSVVEQAMAFAPDDRYRSARDLARAVSADAPVESGSPPWLLPLLLGVPALAALIALAVVLLGAGPVQPPVTAAEPSETAPLPPPADAQAAKLDRLRTALQNLTPEHASVTELEAITLTEAPGLQPLRDRLANQLLARARRRGARFAPLRELLPLLKQAERFAVDRELIATIQLARATYAFRRGRFQEATRLADRIEAEGRTKFQARYVSAYGQLWQDRFPIALPALEQLWRDDPQGVVGQNAGAVFNSHTGKNDVGVKLARAALALDPTYVDAYCSLAFCLNDLSNKLPERKAELLAASLEASSHAIRLSPDHPRPYMARGFALGNSGRAAEQLLAYDEVIRLTGPRPMARVLRFRASRRLQSGDSKGAMADLALALERDPNDVEALTWRGVIRERAGKGEAAIRDWRRAYETDRNTFGRALRGMHPRLRQRVLSALGLRTR